MIVQTLLLFAFLFGINESAICQPPPNTITLDGRYRPRVSTANFQALKDYMSNAATCDGQCITVYPKSAITDQEKENSCKFPNFFMQWDGNDPNQFGALNPSLRCPFQGPRNYDGKGGKFQTKLRSRQKQAQPKDRNGYRSKCRQMNVEEMKVMAGGNLFSGNAQACSDYLRGGMVECYTTCVLAPNLQACNHWSSPALQPNAYGWYVEVTDIIENGVSGQIRPCDFGSNQLGYSQLCKRIACTPQSCIQNGAMGRAFGHGWGHCNFRTRKCDDYDHPCLTNANSCPPDRPICIPLANTQDLDPNAGQCGCTHANGQDYDAACNDPTDLHYSDGQTKRSICLPGIAPKGQCAGCTDGNDGASGLNDIRSDNCAEDYKCTRNAEKPNKPWLRTCESEENSVHVARREYANEYLVEQERKVNALRLAELESKLKVMKAQRAKKEKKKKGYGTWRN